MDLPQEVGRATRHYFERTWECDTPAKTRQMIMREVHAGRGLQAELAERMVFAAYRDSHAADRRTLLATGVLHGPQGEWIDWD